MSVQLPKDTSWSTMGRSVISAPVLTSTTNSKVAATEGVACQDTFGEEHSYETSGTEARRLAEIMVERPMPHHRPSRRFVDMLKEKLRRRERNFVKIEEEPTGIHRRRAETINLCKDKIKNLTGNGYINRKSITESDSRQSGTEHLLGYKDSRSALLRKTSQAALEFDSQNHPDNDSHFGSLSRSFNSALEKLDFQSNTLLHSRSSIFNMRKPCEKQEVTPSVEPHQPPYTPRPAFAKLEDRSSTDKNTNAVNESSATGTGAQTTNPANTAESKSPKMTQQRPDPAVNKEGNEGQGYGDGRASQLQWSSGGYTLARPYPNYPGGVNPLRMHTNIMAMAGQQMGGQGGGHDVAERNILDNNETETSSAHNTDLEDAPIFSPSMGDLSQYSRTPPAAKTTTPALTPSKPATNRSSKREGGMEKVDAGKKDENRSPKVKKSKSFSSLVNIFKKEEAPPMPKTGSSPFMPATPSPLRTVHTAKGNDKKRYGMVGVPSPK